MAINLLPEELRGKSSGYRFHLLPGLLFLGFLLGASSILFLFGQIILLEIEQQELENALAEMRARTAVEKNKGEDLAQLEKERLVLLVALSRNQLFPALRAVSEAINPHLRLLSIDIDPSGETRITGEGNSLGRIAEMIQRLDNSDQFAAVKLRSVKKGENNEQHIFQVELILNR